MSFCGVDTVPAWYLTFFWGDWYPSAIIWRRSRGNVICKTGQTVPTLNRAMTKPVSVVMFQPEQKWPYNIHTVYVDAAFSCFGICSKVPRFTKSDLTLLQLIKAGKEGVFYQARMSRGTCKGHSMFTCKISKEGRYCRGLCSSYRCWVLKNKNHWLIWA